MKNSYRDIVEKLGAPLWWDDNGTPRYSEFHPSLLPDIYARQAVLYEIQCQGCRTRFKVSYGFGLFHREDVSAVIKDHQLHYGDPPNYGCCGAGPTMNSEPIRVISVWHRPNMEWVELEELRNHPLE